MIPLQKTLLFMALLAVTSFPGHSQEYQGESLGRFRTVEPRREQTSRMQQLVRDDARRNDENRIQRFSLPASDKSTLADSLPGRWMYVSENLQTLPCDDQWWKTLGDPMLDSLINLGVERNQDVVAAIHRIGAARQAVRRARAGYYPEIGVGIGWTKTRSSGEQMKQGRSSTLDYFTASASMNWEIDIFGRVTAQARREQSLYNASRAEYAAAMVSLCGEIARNYAQLRTAQAELAVARAHIALQDSVMHIANHRFEAELASKLDVEQAATTYYATVASLPSLEAQIATSINAIAVLVGDFPEKMAATLAKPAPIPLYEQNVAVGLPLDLIRRRPDVIAAEYQLAAAARAVGIAKKDFLPTLSITGSIGTVAHKADKLFSHESFTYTIAPQLSWTLFDGFARSASVAAAREEMEASISQYNESVLTAVEEVDNAMSNYSSCLREAGLMGNVLEHAQKSFELSFDLYRSGLTSFTTLSDSQIAYLQYANSLVAARGNAILALVNLYEALGGGWTTPE